jgi:hypothetical protein
MLGLYHNGEFLIFLLLRYPSHQIHSHYFFMLGVSFAGLYLQLLTIFGWQKRFYLQSVLILYTPSVSKRLLKICQNLDVSTH